jgi:non-specific serine/threonine protein kinase
MLETIREYALERLDVGGEAGAIRDRHAAWCLEFAKLADADLEGPGMFRWLLRVEAEHGNLRVAIQWLKDRGDTGAALRLGAGLSAFWWYRGHYDEGRSQLEGLLALPDARAHPYAWARAMTGLATLYYKSGGVQRGMRLHEQAVAVWRELGDPARLAYARWCQGLAAGGTDDDLAVAALTETVETGHALNKLWLALPAVWALGRIARCHGDYRRAEDNVTEALHYARELGHPIGVPLSLVALGHIALDQGNIDRASSLIGESLGYLRQVGEGWGGTGRLKGFSGVAAAPWGVPACLEGLATVAGARGEPARAARLFGATAVLRDLVGYAREPVDQPGFERWEASVRAALGEDAYAAAWAEGRTLAFDDAVSEALAIAGAGIMPAAPGVGGSGGSRGRIEDGDGQPRRRAAGVQSAVGG